MRIALVGPYHPDIGGVQIYTMHLAGELMSLGHDVVVVSYHYASSRWGEQVRRSPNVGIRGLRGLAFMTHSAFSLVREGPDVALAQYAITSGVAAWLASFLGVPYTVTFHGSDLRISPRLSRIASSRAEAVISVSSWLAERLEDSGIEVSEIIPGGINPEPFLALPPKEEVREGLGLDPRDKLVLSVGALIEAKGFDMVPEVAALLSRRGIDAKFLLIGEGPLRRIIEGNADRLSVRNRIILLGRKKFEETVKYYKAADLLLHPARYEGYGLVIREAMAAGTPVITTDVGGARDLVEDGVNGYIEDRDAEKIADRVAFLLLNDDLREEMGERGRDKALSRTWRHVALDYLRLLGKVLS
ncbi:MAG: glycosyltransferase family 4 protein [Candidatus Korarchaeota archaeon]|nr:glycosyltransferase family 4 protein [Candidatus Korarchaeota archaeon]